MYNTKSVITYSPMMTIWNFTVHYVGPSNLINISVCTFPMHQGYVYISYMYIEAVITTYLFKTHTLVHFTLLMV